MAVLALAPVTVRAAWVVPGGQEALVEQMLGAPPAPCSFLGAAIDRSLVRARYQCADRPFVVELRHPSEVPPGALRTQQFGIVVPPEAPPGFDAALAGTLRAHEAGFRWSSTESVAADRPSDRVSRASILDRLFAPSQPRQSFRKEAFLGVAAGMLAFGTLLAIALRWFGRRRYWDGDSQLPAALLGAIVTFFAALLYYALASHAAPFNLDTTRDILSARDCLETTHECDILSKTSIGLFNQGGLFLHVLALWLTLELPVRALEAALAFFDALSALCVYLLVRRYLAPRLAPITTALYLVTSLYVLDYPVVFNISVSLLPMAACLLALMGLISTGATAWTLMAAVAFTLAADAHVIFLMYLPWLLFAVAATDRRPVLATLLVFVAIAVTGAAQSLSTWLANVRLLFESSTLLPTFVGLAITFVAGFRLRSHLAELDPRARCAALLAAPTALYFFAYLGARMLLRDAPPMYVVPALVGLCVATAALLDLAAARLARGAFTRQRALLALALPLVAAIHLWRSDHSGPRFWSMGEVEKVEQVLYERGYRFADLRAHLQTSRDGLLAALGAFEPRRPLAGATAQDDVLLLRVPRALLPATIPPTWTLVDLRPGYAAVLRPISSLLDRQHMEACYRPADGTPDLGGCLQVDIASAAARQKIAAAIYTARMFLAIHEAENTLHLVTMQKQHGSAVRFKVPITAPASGPTRLIEIIPTRFPWYIEAVDGVRVRDELPSTRITVEADGARGTLIFAGQAPSVEERHELYLPPPIAETEEGERELRDLLEVQPF
jgi:hypothetical protein